MACIICHGFNDLKTIFFFCCIVCIFLGIWQIFYIEMCRLLRKSACPLGQVQTKMYLPKSPLFKNSLAEASRQVPLLVPVLKYIFLTVSGFDLSILSSGWRKKSFKTMFERKV